MPKRTKSESLKQQIIKYLISGGGFFWSGYLAFAVFDGLLGFNLFIAKQLANVIGITVNYLLERYWVFRGVKTSKAERATRLPKYIAITLINFMIDYLIVLGLKDIGITPYLGQFVSAAFFTVWNFLWYKYWVFAHHTPRTASGRKK